MASGSLLRPEVDEPQATVTVCGREFTVARARLGGFLRIQMSLEGVERAAKAMDTGALTGAMFTFLNTAIGIDRQTFFAAPWLEVMRAHNAAAVANRLPETEMFAMMKYAERGKPVAWDYPGRPLINWLHSFAEAYGWTKDEVFDLWPEEAVALLQEIEVSEFSRREFEHMHSELAYHYDKRGKGTYQPLRKPFWMVFRAKRVVTRLSRKSLPVGLVIFREGESVESAPSTSPESDHD